MFSLQILSLLAALHCVILEKLQTVTGTEGGRVDIRCLYSDNYKTSHKYWCRDPCSDADVLVKAKKQDLLYSVGRFSLIDKAANPFFIVTIRNLALQDSGVYFCGVQKMFKDLYTKVKLTVSKAPSVSTQSTFTTGTHLMGVGETTSNRSVLASTLSPTAPSVSTQSTFTIGTHLMGVGETTSNRSVLASTLSPTGAASIAVGATFGVMLCLFTVSLILLRKKKASSSVATNPTTAMEPFNTVQEKEGPEPVYDNENVINFSSHHAEYCTVQYCAPSQELNNTATYTFIGKPE
ncbi:hypothetical protein AAFF_G00033680 [Aldrovandia affinis]|uniref:Ig-like domain-containing protein n=1 Tax=Aldrovandia affinis TaxID=143900 RepID=A0AAD7WFY8_9TELE|nr:hypothetical protein AAFF_G00033680 [Aldrovandia affinis]